jgi:acyl carrier protein
MSEQEKSCAERVRTLIAEQLHIKAEEIKPEATLESLGADSLDVVELIMRFEDEFSIEIDDAAAEKLHTYGDVVKYLDEAIAKRE